MSQSKPAKYGLSKELSTASKLIVPEGEEKRESGSSKSPRSETLTKITTEDINRFKEWIREQADLENVQEIIVIARARKKSLVAQTPEDFQPAVSYVERSFEGRNNTYWYKRWTENGKQHYKYVGKKLPNDLDPAKATVIPLTR